MGSAVFGAHEHEHVFLGADRRVEPAKDMARHRSDGDHDGDRDRCRAMYGLMPLVVDGWLMSIHTAAMLIAAVDYVNVRRNGRNPRLTRDWQGRGSCALRGTVMLVLVALLMRWESFVRFQYPMPVIFGQAIAVAASAPDFNETLNRVVAGPRKSATLSSGR